MTATQGTDATVLPPATRPHRQRQTVPLGTPAGRSLPFEQTAGAVWYTSAASNDGRQRTQVSRSTPRTPCSSATYNP